MQEEKSLDPENRMGEPRQQYEYILFSRSRGHLTIHVQLWTTHTPQQRRVLDSEAKYPDVDKS